MKALILAAGYATRLYPITKEYPKTLLEVNGRPILDHIIERLEPVKEIDKIIVVTNSRFFPQFREWKAGKFCAKKLSLVDDGTSDNSSRMGAIGDMDFAIRRKRILDDLLVIGGDNLFGGELAAFLNFAKRKKPHPVIGIFDLGDLSNASHYGVVSLDRRKRITDFQEKPKSPKTTLVAMCLYYFPKERLALIREYLHSIKRSNDATGFYIDWLRKRIAVYGFIFKSFWFDIGSHKSYSRARQRLFI